MRDFDPDDPSSAKTAPITANAPAWYRRTDVGPLLNQALPFLPFAGAR